MQLKNRLSRLEKQSGTDQDWPIALVYWVNHDSTDLGFAVIANSGLGHIEPRDGETEAAFKKRVLAMKCDAKNS